MVHVEVDEAHTVILWIDYVDPRDARHDYSELFARLALFDQEAKRTGAPALLVIVSDPGASLPNAADRRLFAEQAKRPRTNKVYTALVTSSAAARGIVTAINWLTGSVNRVDSVHGTVEEAVRWAERQLPGYGAIVKRLYERARGAVTARLSA